MSFDLEQIERAVLSAPPALSTELPPALLVSDINPQATIEAAADAVDNAIQFLTSEAWGQQWGLMHDMAGGMIGMRTGQPCPLGDQARTEQGQIAAQAAYDLLMSQPMLAKVFLSTSGELLGQIAAIGMHGFACVQIVKASRSEQTTDEMPEFVHHQPDTEAA